MKNSIWVADPSHSEIQFKVKHLMVSNVTGYFRTLDAKVESSNEDFKDAKIHFTADASSITTGSEQRDQHLVSADFFEAEKFPQLSFESTSFTPKGDEEYELKGNLTIKGITNPVTLNVEYAGKAVDPWGNEKAGFTIQGKISRKEWALNWNAALETGGVLVSDEVKLNMEVQLVKATEAVEA